MFTVREAGADDREWIQSLLTDHWGSCLIVSRGRAYHADQLPGFIAADGENKLGLLTYSISGPECEILTLDALEEKRGVGSALLKAVETTARLSGCRRAWLITTNDNLKALRFYQKRGFVLVAVHRGAIEASRKLKPEIPRLGFDGIAIRDELELEIGL
jgi:N-acetylglutamate synthase-like GNAT family acetyltransferase